MASDDSDDEHATAAYHQIIVSTIYLLIESSSSLLNSPVPCMTSKQTGDKWVGELLHGAPVRFYNTFMMSQPVFLDLLFTLEDRYGLKGTRRTSAREVLALTIYILLHNLSMRKTCERFQHSTETVSRFLSAGIEALLRLEDDIIQSANRTFSSTPSEILHDMRYMSFFKDCVGAIDGTHVDACITVGNKVPYIERHGKTTQNVMAACDFNMCFTFVLAGWEGSRHDSRIFNFTLNDPRYKFPRPPPGKYYLVDAGYLLQRGYLKLYPDTRYHLPDFAHANRPPIGRREMFNQAHSSLRSVIERSFGVLKKKWAILSDMPSYSFDKQEDIVMAAMTLHNFIRRHPSRTNINFSECETQDATTIVGF